MRSVNDVKSETALLLSELERVLKSDNVVGADLNTLKSKLSDIKTEIEVMVKNG